MNPAIRLCMEDILEGLKRDRRNVDAYVDEAVRKTLCKRFPGYSYEEIAADIYNERVIAGAKAELRAIMVSRLNRKIAKLNALRTACGGKKTRETAKAPIVTVTETDG
jgi:hypothetical protein